MYDSAHVVRAQRRKKDYAVRAFGGKCQKCGYDKCQGALEFHHLNGETKEHNPGYIIARWAWEKAKSELEKCVLLCANCHREAHYIGNNNDDLILRRLARPFATVRCARCLKNFDTKLEGAKYCSRTCCYLAERKVIRPDKETLVALIDSGTTWIQMGRMFGVSDTSVKKWAENYGVEIPVRRPDVVKFYEFECKCCLQKFRTPEKNAKFCSPGCGAIASRKNRPAKDELKNDLAEMSFYKVSLKYGVSHRTVRAWAKRDAEIGV